MQQAAASKKKKKGGAPQPYIPGLTPRGPSPPVEAPANTPKDVPPELISAFLEGLKNPISSLMEYCAMKRLTATFKEAPSACSAFGSMFASVCTVEGKSYPQGTGKTKKEAKTEAARVAFCRILGVGDDSMEPEEGSYYE